MVKNIIIVILVIIVVAEGYFLYQSHNAMKQQQMAIAQNIQQKSKPPAGPDSRRKGGPPIMLGKGDNLKTSPLLKYAYQIAPGSLSADAQKALVGWKITTEKAESGAIIVTLTPSDSEDQRQQYTVATGNILYFIEQTPVDDKADQDKDLNYRDDYGIITDSNGVIQ